jgi:hypothetical protein
MWSALLLQQSTALITKAKERQPQSAHIEAKQLVRGLNTEVLTNLVQPLTFQICCVCSNSKTAMCMKAREGITPPALKPIETKKNLTPYFNQW